MNNLFDKRLRLLIIDDGDETSDQDKGYNKIADHYAHLFRIERVWSWNSGKSARAGQPLGVRRIMEQTFDLILLDQIFEGQPTQGYEILHDIRNALKDFPGLTDEQRELAESNKDVYVIGVSTEWKRYAEIGLAPNAWTPPEHCDSGWLGYLIGQFLRECWLKLGLDHDKQVEPWEKRRQLRELFPGEELQVCCDGETGVPHCWAPPLGAFVRVSNDPLIARFAGEKPGVVYMTGEMDKSMIGASHLVPLYLQPNGKEDGHWGGHLATVVQRVPAPGVPRLVDIAKHAVLADEVNVPSDLISTVQSWWVKGAEVYGLSVSIFYNEVEPFQPPEMREWLLNEEKTRSWPRPDSRGILPPEERGEWRLPRELGEVMEFEGARYVLVGFIQTGHWSCGVVDSAAFVPADEVQL